MYPGERFSLSVVVIGQRNGTVPGVILATIHESSSLAMGTHVQRISSIFCSQISYIVYSYNSTENISLQVQSPQYSSGIYFHPKLRQIQVSLKPCPPGFRLAHIHPGPYCDCVQLLADNKINCSISDQTIHRPSPVWIGYHSEGRNNDNPSNNVPNTGVIFHHHCPFDYCLPYAVNISVTSLTIKELRRMNSVIMVALVAPATNCIHPCWCSPCVATHSMQSHCHRRNNRWAYILCKRCTDEQCHPTQKCQLNFIE